ISAAWFIAFAFSQLPLGLALDRIGPRRIVPALMLCAAAGAALLAFARSSVDCILANTLIGLGCSPIYMGALYVFARNSPPERFGFLTATMLGLGSSGNLLAATPLSIASEAYGWRTTFLAIAVIVVVSAALIWLLVRDPPQARRPETSENVFVEYIRLLTLPRLWSLLPLLMLGYGIVLAERGLWVGPYLADVYGLSPVARGNATLVMAIAMSLGALVFGALDGVIARQKLVAGGALVAGSSFVSLWMIVDAPLWVAVALLTVIGFAGLGHPLLVAHARSFFPDHLVGRGITLANFAAMIGAGLLQWISGIYVVGLQLGGLQPPGVYAALHLAFGLGIISAALIYVTWAGNAGPPRPA
ncbi:MAG: nitrate/nitrite transporter, partial [Hyphomicrobiaceae bacterium]